MQTNVTAASVAREVRAAMARAGVSQAELAAALGMSQAAVSRRVSRNPEVAVEFNVTQLSVIAEIFGIPLSALLVNAGQVRDDVPA